MLKLKKIFIVMMLAAFAFSTSALAQTEEPTMSAEEDTNACEQFDFTNTQNPFVNIILLPVKMVLALAHLPRCILVDHFPVNEPKE